METHIDIANGDAWHLDGGFPDSISRLMRDRFKRRRVRIGHDGQVNIFAFKVRTVSDAQW